MGSTVLPCDSTPSNAGLVHMSLWGKPQPPNAPAQICARYLAGASPSTLQWPKLGPQSPGKALTATFKLHPPPQASRLVRMPFPTLFPLFPPSFLPRKAPALSQSRSSLLASSVGVPGSKQVLCHPGASLAGADVP